MVANLAFYGYSVYRIEFCVFSDFNRFTKRMHGLISLVPVLFSIMDSTNNCQSCKNLVYSDKMTRICNSNDCRAILFHKRPCVGILMYALTSSATGEDELCSLEQGICWK